jgi:hypothetical protein
MNERIFMNTDQGCPFYRKPEGCEAVVTVGYCDFDANRTLCAGKIERCENPETLDIYIQRNGWRRLATEKE